MDSDRTVLSEDLSELTKVEPMRRIELIAGDERRRKRSPDEKAAIIAASMVPGAVIAEVARRYGISPQQLYGWRSDLKTRSHASDNPSFSPVIIDDKPSSSHADITPEIELSFGQARVVIRGAVDQKTLGTVLKAVKGLA